MNLQRLTCLFLLLLSCPFPVRAGGIPVFDAANLQQAAISAVEAVNQTLKQIEQYARTRSRTASPPQLTSGIRRSAL